MNSSQILAFVKPQAMPPNVFGNRRLPVIIVQVGALLAACIKFLATPILSMLIFAVLVIAGAGSRRRTDLHRPCFGDTESVG